MLCAADVRLTELGLEVVSAPLQVLPFAEVVEARWGAERDVESEPVGLEARLGGTPGGAERLEREPAEVAVFVRTGLGAAPLDEPVVVLRSRFERGRLGSEQVVTLGLERWPLLARAGHDADRVPGEVPL